MGGGRGLVVEDGIGRTDEIAPCSNPQTPAGMLRQCVEHVVEESDSCPYPDMLVFCDLRGVSFLCLWWNGWGRSL